MAEHRRVERRVERRAPTSVVDFLGGMGSSAALIVGLVYAVGALVKTVELRNAHVSIGEAFPLIPIQQHLSRGMEIFLAPRTLAWTVGLFAVGGLVHRSRIRWLDEIGLTFDGGLWIGDPDDGATDGQRNAPTKSQTGQGGASAAPAAPTADTTVSPTDVTAIWVTVIGAFALALFLFVSIKSLIGTAVPVALVGGVLLLTHSSHVENGKRRWFFPTPALVLAVALVLGSGAVIDAFAISAELPPAMLQMTGSKPLSGHVIAVTDQAWYLAVPGGNLRVVDAARVSSATVSTPRQTKNRLLRKTLFELTMPTPAREVNAVGSAVAHGFEDLEKRLPKWTSWLYVGGGLAIMALVFAVTLARSSRKARDGPSSPGQGDD